MKTTFAALYPFLVMLLSQNNFAQEKARFIWTHDTAQVRNDYAYFRYECSLSQQADEAVIHLYADSRYQLFINEIFINFGPARAYPQHPEYDTYDLARFLKQGKNVIAVKALYNGIENFQVPDNRPGFIAWGRIKTKDETIILDTPGQWVCRKSSGYDQHAVRFSFACAAMEVYDARKGDGNWMAMDGGRSVRQKPVIINDQRAWSPLQPRSIPDLTKIEQTAKYLVGAYQLNEEEDLYSFRIKTPDEARRDYNRGPSILAYTYIYSPEDQDVEVGLWWGEYYLNGKGPLQGSGEVGPKINRDPRLFKLKKGWNFFNIHYGAVWGAWDFYMALPKSAGLAVSPTKNKASRFIFMTAGPLPWERNDELKQFDRPFRSAEEMEAAVGVEWTGRPRAGETNNPALDMVWKYTANRLDFSGWQTRMISITKAGPGTALVFDMGGKTLGRLFIEFEAPAGTTIDIGFSEDLLNGIPWLFKRKMISAATRCIADGRITRYETFKPYGLRYLQVNISGNDTPVTIKKIGVIEQIYPFEKGGWFECSDPMFNAIWELGWRTLRVCAEDSYIDTPFRERGLYAGDMLPEYAITLAASGDSRLVKRSLKVFHDKYRLMMYGEENAANGEFPLINILTSKWAFDHTGDTTFVKYIYDGYKNLLNRWLNSADENGNYYLGRPFIEWTKIDKTLRLTATHAILARSLEIMAAYAQILGNPDEANFFQTKAEALKRHTASRFWDPERNLFNDGYKEGRLQGRFYPTSNAWSLLFGCTDQDQNNKIINYLRQQFLDIGEISRDRRITPYSAFYALAALYQNERADIAERFIRQYWTRMILGGDDTAWENFDIKSEQYGGGQGTASHAWSGHPTFFLSTEVLGVSLGFHKEFERKKIIISPQSENISWARGVVPHPLGSVFVAWQVEGRRLFLNYKAAPGAEVTVKPRGRLAEYELWVNGVRSF